MLEQKGNTSFSGKPIYTLAQSGTETRPTPIQIVSGKGSDITDGVTAESRAKRKLVSVNLALACIDVAKQKKDSEMEQTLWNIYHCQRKIISVNGVIFGMYCGNRGCTVCMSIRKAQIINSYYPIISQWQKPYFVTLTVKSCPAKRLPLMMNKMVQGFQLIKDRQRKRHERGKGIKLVGIRTLESNYNPKKRTYNPHFHIIVENKEMGELLITEWLKQWTPKFAGRQAQDIRPITDLTIKLKELIKYSTKVFTDPTVEKYKHRKGNTKFFAKAFYNVLISMKGHRIFERFGFNNPSPKEAPTGAKAVVDFDLLTYDLKQHDWVNNQTGEALTNYAAPEELLDVFLNRVDSELE